MVESQRQSGVDDNKAMGSIANGKDEEIIDPIMLVKMLLEHESMFGIKQLREVEGKYCLSFVSHGYRQPLMKTIKFVTHFFVVMLLLYCGAVVFAHIEDPEDDQMSDDQIKNVSCGVFNVSCVGFNYPNSSIFWNEFQLKYDINVSESVRKLMIRDVRKLIDMEEKEEVNIEYQKDVRDRTFIFTKWFYFVTIATTTIGYGDIHPKTTEGKAFYCVFSIIGIILMMSLLKSCGAILNEFNKGFYGFLKTYVWCKDKQLLSEELLSVITITFIFFCFLLLGIWHGKMMKTIDWSLVDVVYYWIVTFTTVGFGDVVHPLHVEMDHVYDLVVYRIIGLAILAAIIDSITAYIKLKKKILEEDTIKFSEGRKDLLERTIACLREKEEKAISSLLHSPILRIVKTHRV